jgi:uroporphyrin-III C-methyltransferase/precorrin-2 dehydrogenase/sirohydrochlorin ferrochelatase
VTTVVLMGVRALPGLVTAALAHGVPARRPVAIIENGHTPRQRTTRTTLGEAVRAAREADVASPAVIVIGEVARPGLLHPEPAALPALATAPALAPEPAHTATPALPPRVPAVPEPAA